MDLDALYSKPKKDLTHDEWEYLEYGFRPRDRERLDKVIALLQNLVDCVERIDDSVRDGWE